MDEGRPKCSLLRCVAMLLLIFLKEGQWDTHMLIVQVRDDVILQFQLALQVVYVLLQFFLLFAALVSELIPFVLILALFPARPVQIRFGQIGRGSFLIQPLLLPP
jgi:hypothetical protein